MNRTDNRIALNIIVKNESKFLRGCLESVKDLVDEIVIADTGSTDNTVEIASEFTDKILYFIWNNDFSEARNFVINNTDANWVLYLDADERIDKIYHDQIRELVNSGEYDAFQLKIKSRIDNETGSQIHIVPYPRLFRKYPDVMFEGKIHEQITPSLVKAGAKFKITDIIIEHLGYAQGAEINEQKKNRNLEALKELVKTEPNNAYALFQLGQNYITLGNTEEGINCLWSALKTNQLTSPVRATTMTALAKYLYDHNKHQEAIDLCRASLEIAPFQLFGKLLLSEILFVNKNVEESVKLLREAYSLAVIPENSRKVDVATDVSYEPAFIKYLIGQRLQSIGLVEEASKAYKEAVELNPHFNEAYLELSGINYYFGSYDSALQCLKHINPQKINSVTALMNMAGIYDELKKYSESRSVLERVIKLDPANAKAYFFIGNSYLYESDFIKAEEYYLKSYSCNTQVKETLLNLAFVSIKRNNYMQALEYYKHLEVICPDDEGIKRKIKALEMKLFLENSNNQK